MSPRCNCRGTISPDFTRLEKNKALHSPSFIVLGQRPAIGDQSGKLEEKLWG